MAIRIQLDTTSMKMELRSRAIDKIYKRRDRIEMPEFQREEVWPDEKKRLLIDTILRGWHIPKLYFRKIDEQSFECVDGQQRLVTIWEFYGNKLALSPESSAKYGGSYYKDLPLTLTDDFDDFELDIEEIVDADDRELEELFQRLQLGTPLNSPERLNAVGGEMRDFVKALAKTQYFTDSIAVKDTRFAHFDIASKWLFVEARGIQPQMRFAQLEKLFQDNRTFSTSSELAKRINLTAKFLQQAFPDKVQWLRNRANVLSVCMLASEIVKSKLDRGNATLFSKFVNSYFEDLAQEVERGSSADDKELLEYQQSISFGSTGGDSIRKRLDILTSRIATFNSAFAKLLASARYAAKAQSGLSQTAEKIRKLIHDINERRAASAGEDLFKMTNASAAALSNIGNLVTDVEGYGAFIDGLYALLYEGTGSCNRLPTPPPTLIMDLKHLRTGLRHDVDHGKDPDVAKKRVKIGTIFRTYSGKASPAECSPEEFAAFQSKFLQKVRKMLEGL
jgi:hypothetical protein